ncbi:MAG: hypothetical protein PHF84_04710 [bacterium]|nr:hypothetical protein [bacterium]
MKKAFFILILIIFSQCGETPSPLQNKFDKGEKGNVIPSSLIHSFEDNYNPNDLDGWTGIGSSNQDSISNQVTASEFYNGLKSLRMKISHSQELKGYSWLACTLGPDTETDKDGNPAPQKRDVSDYAYIGFYIKVMQDWTRFYVELGDITTPQGQSIKVPVTVIRKPAKWQLVKVKLDDFSGIDLERVTKFVISLNEDIETQQNIEFYLDDIGFMK